jgi:signal peptidase I
MRVATGILAVALAVLWLGFAPTQIGGSIVYTSTVGNSMEPLLHKGDLALVRRSGTYRVGDIVLYRSPVLHRPVLHRILAIDHGRYVFKGDHNDFVDPGYASRADLIGTMWFHVPKAGKIMGFVAKPTHSAALIGAAMLLLMLPGARVRRRKKKRHSSMKAPLHLHRPRHPAEDVATLALVAAAAAAVVVGFTSPLKRSVSIEGAYSQTGTFSYSAPTGKPDAAYPTGHVRTGDPLFLHHVDLVHFKYVYRLSSTFAHGVRGTIGLSARVALEASSWHQSYALVKGHPFSGDTATVLTTLSIRKDLMAIVHELTIDSGSPAGQYDLTLLPVVHIRGFVDGHPIDEIFAPPLAFTLSGETIKLNVSTPAALPGQGIVPGSAQAALDATIRPTVAGSIPGKAPAYRTIARARLSVLDLRGLGLGLGGLALLVLLTRPLRRRHDTWSAEQQLASRQGCVIVDVVDLDLTGSVTEVRSFSDLVAFARYLERPILHDLRTGTFAADDGGRLCTYRPAVETAPLPQPVAPASAPRRRGVRLRWLGLGLAIVVAAGIVVSFTAANVVPLTNAGVSTDATSLSELIPARCGGMNLTHLVTAVGGSATGTAANDLILGDSVSKGTLSGGAGNDCIVSGASKATIDGGTGADVCIGTGSNTTFKNCEATYTTP